MKCLLYLLFACTSFICEVCVTHTCTRHMCIEKHFNLPHLGPTFPLVKLHENLAVFILAYYVYYLWWSIAKCSSDLSPFLYQFCAFIKKLCIYSLYSVIKFLYKVPLLFKRRLQEERPFYFLGISKSTSMKTPKYGGRKKEENRNQNTENRAGAWSGLKKQNSLFLSCIYIVLCSCKLPKHYT